MYRWLAHLALRRHRAILAVSGLALVLSAFVLWRGGTLTSGITQGIESDVAQQLVSRELAYPAESSFIIVFQGRDGLVWKHPSTGSRFTSSNNVAVEHRPSRSRCARSRDVASSSVVNRPGLRPA